MDSYVHHYKISTKNKVQNIENNKICTAKQKIELKTKIKLKYCTFSRPELAKTYQKSCLYSRKRVKTYLNVNKHVTQIKRSELGDSLQNITMK